LQTVTERRYRPLLSDIENHYKVLLSDIEHR